MKKISLVVLAIATALCASAQADVLKEAQKAVKDKKQEAANVVRIITPAFTNPETKDLAETWYIPGKASFNEYDNLLGKMSLGMLPADQQAKMGNLLVDGYDYFIKALPLDSLPDAKGKVKPKYSKDILSTISGHFSDYVDRGVDLYNAKDYKGAYRAWTIYCDLAESPTFAEVIKNRMPNDTLVSEIAFNTALAAWNSEDFESALKAFDRAKAKGYHKKTLYDYAIAVASRLNNEEALLAYAREAQPIYGQEDPMYLSQIVNYYLQKKDFENAFKFLNEAISQNPNNAQYYVIQGVLYENEEKKAEAKDSYAKAIKLDEKNAQALYNYGRLICDEAYTLNDNSPSTQAEYDVFYKEKIEPLFLQAADILEKAYDYDPENPDTLRYLENIYYNLKDEAKYQDVQSRMNK